MAIRNGKVFVVGAGSMAEAFIRGVTANGAVPGERILVLNRSNGERIRRLSSEYGIKAASGWSDADGCDLVVISVKPYDVAEALSQVTPYLHGQPVVSFAAGVTLRYLCLHALERSPVVRTMPNIPVAVMSGVTEVAFGEGISEEQKQDILFLLRQLGTVLEIDESKMDAATAVTGSGPGFVSYLLEALEEGAVKLGFSPDEAHDLVLQTVVGTIKTLEDWELTPKEMRTKVTSPNGTTHAGIMALTEGSLASVIESAFRAAAKRSAEMAKQYSGES